MNNCIRQRVKRNEVTTSKRKVVKKKTTKKKTKKKTAKKKVTKRETGLDKQGRLLPGYRYMKGGKVVKAKG